MKNKLAFLLTKGPETLIYAHTPPKQGMDMKVIETFAAETGVKPCDVLHFANGLIDMMEREGATEYLGDAASFEDRATIISAYVAAYTEEQKALAMRVLANPADMQSLCNRVYAKLAGV